MGYVWLEMRASNWPKRPLASFFAHDPLPTSNPTHHSAFTPLSDALAPSLPLPIAGTAAADEASLSEDDAALVAAVGHSLAMQQAEAEAEAEEQEQEESAGKKGAVTGVLGRMMLTWGLGGGSDSFVVVEREAANPSSSTSAAAVAAAEKEG